MSFGGSIRNWSIKTKIVSTFALFTVVLLLVLFGLYAVSQQKGMQDRYTETSRGIVLVIEGARDDMEQKWLEGLLTPEMMRQFAAAGDSEKMLSMIPVVTAWRSAYAKADAVGYKFRVPKFSPRNPANQPDPMEAEALQRMKAEDVDETYQIDETSNAIRYYRAVRLSQMCLMCHGDPATSQAIWNNDKGMDPTGSHMENWKAGEIHGAFEVVYSLDQAEARLWNNLALAGVIGLAALILGLFVTFGIARGVTRPIKASAQIIKHSAAGDFSTAIDPGDLARGDEVGLMINDLDQMNQSLSDIVRQVAKAAMTVAQNAAEISQGNHELSSRTQQQAAAIEQTASVIDEMTSSVKQNAENAEQANKLAHRAAGMAKEGGASVDRTITAMSEVNQASSKIGDIIGVVNEIAFQTNLLALNAAVEAARAGEAGRGFAVVAGEVRNLATRSSTAAKEIQKLITDSVDKADQGSKLVAESGRILIEIIDCVQSVTETVAEISAASKEQAQAIDEVNRAVAQMDSAVQQNAALVEEAASASESLAGSARNLREKVQDFKVRSSGAQAEMGRAQRAVEAPEAAAPPRVLEAPKPPVKRTAPNNQPKAPAKSSAKAAPADDDFFSSDALEGFEEF